MQRFQKRRSETGEQAPVFMIKQEESMGLPDLGLGLNLNDGDPRAIWMPTEVYPDTVASIVQQINDINYQDLRKEKEARMNDQFYTRPPIKLYVSSYGGSVYDGFGLIGAMSSSKTPIHTIAFGKVMSMGFMIAISGHKRFAFPHTTYMFHSLSGASWGKFAELVESVEEDRRLQHKIDTITTTCTKIVQERLDEVHTRKLDWYFDANTALELECIDEII